MYSHSLLPFLSFSSIIFLSYGIKTSERSFNCPSQDFPSTRISTKKRSEWTQNSSYRNRIIGGDLADSLIDYVGVIVRRDANNSYSYCSAVKIAPTLLIASADCASDTRMQYAFLNRSLFWKLEHEINIKKKHFDPLYISGLADQRKNHALCIIELESSSPDTSKYMRVSMNASLPSQGTYVRIAGYGRTDPDETGTNSLRQVDVPVYPEDKCHTKYNEESIKLDLKKQVCAGYPDRECGVCVGDSGGPMFQYDDNGEPVLVGITILFDEVGCTVDMPTVSVRTAQYLSNFTDLGLREGIELTNSVNELRFMPTSSPSSSIPSAPPSSLPLDKGESSKNVGLIIGIVAGAAIIIVVIMIILLVRRRKSRSNYLEDYVKPDIPREFPQEDPSLQYPPTSELAESVPSDFPSQPNSQTSFPTEIKAQSKSFVEYDVNNRVVIPDDALATHIPTATTIATGSVLEAESLHSFLSSTSTNAPGTHQNI